LDVLFVHPNFPGQFRRLATAFSKIPGLRVFGIGDATWMQGREPPAGVEVIGYPAPEKAAPQSHPWAAPFDAAVRRADMVTKTLRPRKNLGFEPDLIVTHPGWGDAFFLADYFPGARVFSFFEYFYRPRGADVGFDPEFPSRFTDVFRLRAMNTTWASRPRLGSATASPSSGGRSCPSSTRASRRTPWRRTRRPRCGCPTARPSAPATRCSRT
jgi:hypothetical protein